MQIESCGNPWVGRVSMPDSCLKGLGVASLLSKLKSPASLSPSTHWLIFHLTCSHRSHEYTEAQNAKLPHLWDLRFSLSLWGMQGIRQEKRIQTSKVVTRNLSLGAEVPKGVTSSGNWLSFPLKWKPQTEGLHPFLWSEHALSSTLMHIVHSLQNWVQWLGPCIFSVVNRYSWKWYVLSITCQ